MPGSNPDFPMKYAGPDEKTKFELMRVDDQVLELYDKVSSLEAEIKILSARNSVDSKRLEKLELSRQSEEKTDGTEAKYKTCRDYKDGPCYLDDCGDDCYRPVQGTKEPAEKKEQEPNYANGTKYPGVKDYEVFIDKCNMKEQEPLNRSCYGEYEDLPECSCCPLSHDCMAKTIKEMKVEVIIREEEESRVLKDNKEPPREDCPCGSVCRVCGVQKSSVAADLQERILHADKFKAYDMKWTDLKGTLEKLIEEKYGDS